MTQPSRTDWGDSPPAHRLEGRGASVEEIREAFSNGSRIVSITGPGGVGKSTLAKMLASESGDIAGYLCWCGFRNSLPVDQALARTFRLVDPATLPPQGEEDLLDAATALIEEQRVLVVMDNLETVMRAGRETGLFQPAHELLDRLIRRVAASDGAGRLLLTSRDKPAAVRELENPLGLVTSIPLDGLPRPAAVELLKRLGLEGQRSEHLNALAEHHGRNPLALQIVARTLTSEWDGDLGAYVEAGLPLPADIEDLFGHHFDRLSDLERVCLLRAASYRETVSGDALVAELAFRYPAGEVRRAIHRLHERGLVERRDGGFDLQNVVREFGTGRLADALVDEVVRGDWSVARDVALTTPDAPEHVRRAQWRLVEEVGLRLDSALSARLGKHLIRTLGSVKGRGARAVGYAGGTLVNVAVAAGVPLTGLDLADSVLWRCRLEATELHDLDARGSDFTGSLFSDTFGEVVATRFSSDGSLLAIGASDGSVRCWDVFTWTGTSIAAHSGHARDVMFVEDDRMLVSAGDDGAVRMWDWRTSELAWELCPPGGPEVLALAPCPSCGLLAAARSDGSIAVWDIAARRPGPSEKVHEAKIRGLVHAEGIGLISGDEHGRLRVTHPERATLDPEDACDIETPIWFVALSADDGTLAVGGETGEIQILSLPGFAPVGPPLTSLGAPAWSAELLPTRGEIAIASSTGNVVVHSLDSGEIVTLLPAHAHWARALALHPNGRTLASGGSDRAVHIWDLDSGERDRTLQGYQRSFWAVSFTPDGSRLAAGGSDGAVYLWEGPELEGPVRMSGRAWVRSLAFDSTGLLLAVGHDGGVRLRDLAAARWIELMDDGTPVWDVAFSPDGSQLATAGEDSAVRLWDTRAARERAAGGWHRPPVRFHSGWAIAVAFSRDGSLLASGDGDGSVLVGPPEGAPWRLSDDDADQVWALSFLADGRLAAAGRDGKLRLWNVDQDLCHVSRKRAGRSVWAIEQTSEGLLLAGDGGQLMRAGAGDGDPEPLALSGPVDPRVQSIALHPTRRLLATAGSAGVVQVWDLTTGERERALDPDRLYARFDVSAARGLSDAQRASLRDLGAIDDERAGSTSAEDESPEPERRSPPLEEALPRTSVVVHGDLVQGDLVRGDRYDTGQAGAVGPGSEAKSIGFAQIWGDLSLRHPASTLADQLAAVRAELRSHATELLHERAIEVLEDAEAAAREGDGAEAIGRLSRLGGLGSAGGWVVTVATSIGATVAAEALIAVLGL